MGTLVAIIAILFLTLLVIVPLWEKYAASHETRDFSRLSRFIMPLMALLIVLQLIRYYFT